MINWSQCTARRRNTSFGCLPVAVDDNDDGCDENDNDCDDMGDDELSDITKRAILLTSNVNDHRMQHLVIYLERRKIVE